MNQKVNRGLKSPLNFSPGFLHSKKAVSGLKSPLNFSPGFLHSKKAVSGLKSPLNFSPGFLHSKKAESLSMNTIIITILAVIVLIILVVAFRSQIGKLFTSFSDLISGASDSLSNIKFSDIFK
ncbi:MAG: hypothetical protein KKG60_03975 [Nanoarchaeota archaeon]|nr:hypothetical protein [Nanoarchaeota archaeon]